MEVMGRARACSHSSGYLWVAPGKSAAVAGRAYLEDSGRVRQGWGFLVDPPLPAWGLSWGTLGKSSHQDPAREMTGQFLNGHGPASIQVYRRGISQDVTRGSEICLLCGWKVCAPGQADACPTLSGSPLTLPAHHHASSPLRPPVPDPGELPLSIPPANTTKELGLLIPFSPEGCAALKMGFIICGMEYKMKI